jgi:protein-disulfide isomerase
VRAQIWQTLKQANVQRATETYFSALRADAGVEVLLHPPRVRIDVDTGRVRGNPDAPVTIVEFADFQCPFCSSAQATMEALLEKYGSQVKFAYLDFPLSDIHPEAQAAAEAARCAGEEGKFWEYHDLLYANQSRLGDDDLADYARALNLNSDAFAECLRSGRFTKEVEQDAATGKRLGINGTPGFFINGIFLNGAQPAAAFETIIDNELALIRRNSEPAP